MICIQINRNFEYLNKRLSEHLNPHLFFTRLVYFVDLCALRDSSVAKKHGHKAHQEITKDTKDCYKRTVSFNIKKLIRNVFISAKYF
jgi:hypothetical protein